MATAGDLMNASLRLLNVLAVGETASSAQETNLLDTLNRMLDHWAIKDQLIMHEEHIEEHALVVGQSKYEIGNSAPDWQWNWPDRIDRIYVTDGSRDYNLDQISSGEYAEISDKTTRARPNKFWYNKTYYYGEVYVNPVPSEALAVFVLHKERLSNFTAASNTVSLPTGYEDAIVYNLALMAAPEFLEAPEVNPFVVNHAKESLDAIKSSNRQPPPKKKYDHPSIGSSYNIYQGK